MMKSVSNYIGVDPNPNSRADFMVDVFTWHNKYRIMNPDWFVCFHSLYKFPTYYSELFAANEGFVIVETNGSNPIGNLWRKITRKPNRENLFKHPPQHCDGRLQYFGFLAMLPLGQAWFSFAEKIDDFLLNGLGFKSLAWKWVFVWRRDLYLYEVYNEEHSPCSGTYALVAKQAHEEFKQSEEYRKNTLPPRS